MHKQSNQINPVSLVCPWAKDALGAPCTAREFCTFHCLNAKQIHWEDPNFPPPWEEWGEESTAGGNASNKWKHDVLNKTSSIISSTFHLQLLYISAEYFSLATETVSLQLKYVTRKLTADLWKAIILDTDYFPCRQRVLELQRAGEDHSDGWGTAGSGAVN